MRPPTPSSSKLDPRRAQRGFTLTFLTEGSDRKIWQARSSSAQATRVSAYRRRRSPPPSTCPPLPGADRAGGRRGWRRCGVRLADFVTLAPSAQPVRRRRPWPGRGLDLDETLWRASWPRTASRADPAPRGRAAIKALDARGVLHSIASKNSPDEPWPPSPTSAWTTFPASADRWGPKSEAIGAIAAALDLGVDSFVFIDDQPSSGPRPWPAIPRCASCPRRRRRADHPSLVRPSGDARKRRPARPLPGRSYARRQFKAASGDYLGFLRGSGLRLDVAVLAGPTPSARSNCPSGPIS